MADLLRPLRRDLDLMPSPDPDHPGLLMRDPLGYTDRILIVPPPLVRIVALFDGAHDELDIAAAVARASDEVSVGHVVRSLVAALSDGGFLEDEAFEGRRAEAHARFAGEACREASHAGSAYPSDRAVLRSTLDGWLGSVDGPRARSKDLVGLAAPHVSPQGGWRSYAAAYGALRPSDSGRTIVVLGTSHYGPPSSFGLTSKPFETPLGETTPDLEAVDFLWREGGDAVRHEDYCHAVEHSVEFQVVFLQHILGASVRVVPILCGPFDTPREDLPEDEANVKRFLEALRAFASQREDVLFVLGVDLAHVGRRYHDRSKAIANEGELVQVASRDRERLKHVEAGDAEGFWRSVGHPADDDLNWCGTAPLYAFLRSVGPVVGDTLHYDQWNIDPESVVSFAGMEFTKGDS